MMILDQLTPTKETLGLIRQIQDLQTKQEQDARNED